MTKTILSKKSVGKIYLLDDGSDILITSVKNGYVTGNINTESNEGKWEKKFIEGIIIEEIPIGG
jgi:hypothetical protein